VSITLDQITKRYRGTPVVNDVSLEVADGGSSSCWAERQRQGTLLRAIAGSPASTTAASRCTDAT
jgi:ABC-type Fe3+/spermidine/putrescine transport system ATPase subunit